MLVLIPLDPGFRRNDNERCVNYITRCGFQLGSPVMPDLIRHPPCDVMLWSPSAIWIWAKTLAITVTLRILFGMALVLSFLVTAQVQAQMGTRSTELGVIQEIVEDRLYISGETGMHILEPLGICAWCEADQSITIFFDTVTRASIQPYPNPFRKRRVETFIIRDARGDF